MFITSSTANLIEAHDSCGQEVQCTGASACGSLQLSPPPQGGVCEVTVRFADTSTLTAQADWGAPHQTDCCGTQFANTPHIDITADAGAGD